MWSAEAPKFMGTPGASMSWEAVQLHVMLRHAGVLNHKSSAHDQQGAHACISVCEHACYHEQRHGHGAGVGTGVHVQTPEKYKDEDGMRMLS